MSFVLKFLQFLGAINRCSNAQAKMTVYARTTFKVKIKSEFTLSIIVPVYNEQLYIEEVINRLINVDLGVKKEIIIVDDGIY